MLNDSTGSKWPPPTIGMTIEELQLAEQVAKDYAVHVHECFLKKCAELGHVWSEVTRKTRPVYGQVKNEEAKGTHEELCGFEDYYFRKCSRCECYEERKPLMIEKNPFL